MKLVLLISTMIGSAAAAAADRLGAPPLLFESRRLTVCPVPDPNGNTINYALPILALSPKIDDSTGIPNIDGQLRSGLYSSLVPAWTDQDEYDGFLTIPMYNAGKNSEETLNQIAEAKIAYDCATERLCVAAYYLPCYLAGLCTFQLAEFPAEGPVEVAEEDGNSWVELGSSGGPVFLKLKQSTLGATFRYIEVGGPEESADFTYGWEACWPLPRSTFDSGTLQTNIHFNRQLSGGGQTTSTGQGNGKDVYFCGSCPPTTPTTPTDPPTKRPTNKPSSSPSASPSDNPSASPSKSPTKKPSTSPSASPSTSPSARPTVSAAPSGSPSADPSSSPSARPTVSSAPSSSPSDDPSSSPSARPTVSSAPSSSPSDDPSSSPSSSPSADPSSSPSADPSSSPSLSPSSSPSAAPSPSPSDAPTSSPSASPTACPIRGGGETMFGEPDAQSVKFSDIPGGADRWGWYQFIGNFGGTQTSTFIMWAGAGQYHQNGDGVRMGTVTVTVANCADSSESEANWDEFDSSNEGFCVVAEEFHLHVGGALPTMKKGRNTVTSVAPGQYTAGCCEEGKDCYIIVHGVVDEYHSDECDSLDPSATCLGE